MLCRAASELWQVRDLVEDLVQRVGKVSESLGLTVWIFYV